jgi:hypothetical protein
VGRRLEKVLGMRKNEWKKWVRRVREGWKMR